MTSQYLSIGSIWCRSLELFLRIWPKDHPPDWPQVIRTTPHFIHRRDVSNSLIVWRKKKYCSFLVQMPLPVLFYVSVSQLNVACKDFLPPLKLLLAGPAPSVSPQSRQNKSLHADLIMTMSAWNLHVSYKCWTQVSFSSTIWTLCLFISQNSPRPFIHGCYKFLILESKAYVVVLKHLNDIYVGLFGHRRKRGILCYLQRH